MDKRIGLIGAGNMGAALLRGIVKSGLIAPDRITLIDVDKQKTSVICKETGVAAASGYAELVKKSDIIILAVKPNDVKSVLEEIKDGIDSKKILVSIAVGVPIQAMKDVLGDKAKIVRTMPNIPALVGEGMTVISFDKNIEESEKEAVKKLFECSGKAEELEEKLMSEVTALTGSSPAYVFVFIEAMADAAVLSGIPRSLAYKLASQAVLGSAKMVLESGKHPGELKDQVCSPAGTTIEAIAALEKNGFRYAIIDAMNECTKRAKAIGSSSLKAHGG